MTDYAGKLPARVRGCVSYIRIATTIPDRGHALVIDSGWQEVADPALAFVQRFA